MQSACKEQYLWYIITSTLLREGKIPDLVWEVGSFSMDENEAILIRQCQSGCRESFDLLYRKYHSTALQIARRIMGNDHDAEEIFARVLDRINQFRHEASFSSWLRVLATNVCRDMLRKRNRHPTESFENLYAVGEAKIGMKVSSVSQEEELIMKELLENLQEKISRLREGHQKLIVLRYIDGLSYKKIAQLLGCSQSQVKSRLHQARKRLRRACQNLRAEQELLR
jgi:RNA polymerase sigma-70 factor (ECF subfamily)